MAIGIISLAEIQMAVDFIARFFTIGRTLRNEVCDRFVLAYQLTYEDLDRPEICSAGRPTMRLIFERLTPTPPWTSTAAPA